MAMTGSGRRDGLHPDFLRQLDRFADRARSELGIEVRMVSGLRTRAEQQYLYNGWIRRLPGFNLAAKPGESNHEARPDGWGYACDIDPDLQERPTLAPLAAECGLYLAVRDKRTRVVLEHWHLEPVWRHGGQRPAFLDAPPPAVNVPQLPQEDPDVYWLYLLHPAAVNKGEPRDWIVAGGRKFACPDKGYVDRLRTAGAKTIDLSADESASRTFRNGHP